MGKNKNNKKSPKIIFKKKPRKFRNNQNKKNLNNKFFRDNYKNNNNQTFYNREQKRYKNTYSKKPFQFKQNNDPFYYNQNYKKPAVFLDKSKINYQNSYSLNNLKSQNMSDPMVHKKEFVFEINPNNKEETNIFELLFKNLLKKEKNPEKNTEKITQKKEEFKINYEKNVDEIKENINSIDSLIKIGNLFKNENFKEKNYTINVEGIHKMIPALNELNSLVGLKNIKEKLVDQIKFFSQNLHIPYEFETKSSKKNVSFLGLKEKPLKGKVYQKNSECHDDDNFDMMHTVIEGPPGVGKTIFGKILSRIYLSLGICKNNTFKIVRRSDLIGEYLGHTARLTEKAIEESLGGVLFIDEAYSLGNGNGKKMDSYSKECIDTINQALTERKGQFICIIAGYKDELEQNFFSVNPGLKRRFSFKYSIDKYSWKELSEILILKINKIKWKINNETKKWLFDSEFLKNKMDNFPHFGGDIETLLLNIKIEHSSRVFGKHYNIHKIIIKDDIENGYKKFLEKREKKKEYIPFGMYN